MFCLQQVRCFYRDTFQPAVLFLKYLNKVWTNICLNKDCVHFLPPLVIGITKCRVCELYVLQRPAPEHPGSRWCTGWVDQFQADRTQHTRLWPGGRGEDSVFTPMVQTFVHKDSQSWWWWRCRPYHHHLVAPSYIQPDAKKNLIICTFNVLWPHFQL